MRNTLPVVLIQSQIHDRRQIMGDINKGIDILEDLIETCRDGENGYQQAAEKINDSEIRSFFLAQSTERAQFARQLEAEVQRLGKSEPEQTGSAAGAIHRSWMGLKEALGGGTKSILESAEKGEDSAKDAYEEALTDEDLPPSVRPLVQRQAESVRLAHDRVRHLRDTAKAA
jgi:uncharacterized protein (TIGR02284 family)